jgi:3-deoxy-7-phosphoheptulonate synthase
MWTPNSWKTKNYAQNISYTDPIALKNNLNKLSSLPPLVSVREVKRLKEMLAEAALGKRFLLQGGDCAEMFDYAREEPIQNKLKVLLQMSLILTWGGNTPVVRIARMGGQYAKPRSQPTEVIDGKEIPTFKGEIINGILPNDRSPDPSRLLSAYFHSAATINYVKNLLGEVIKSNNI